MPEKPDAATLTTLRERFDKAHRQASVCFSALQVVIEVPWTIFLGAHGTVAVAAFPSRFPTAGQKDGQCLVASCTPAHPSTLGNLSMKPGNGLRIHSMTSGSAALKPCGHSTVMRTELCGGNCKRRSNSAAGAGRKVKHLFGS